MKHIKGIIMGLAVLVLIQSCQSNRKANNYNNKALIDDNGLLFLKNEIEANLVSVKTSGLAISNSKNQRVIQFAKSMIDDHTQLVNDLEKLQTDNFVTANDSIGPVNQQTITNLGQKRSAAFDHAYIQMVISQHVQEINEFKAASANKNSAVAGFAKNTIPSLKAHLDSAKQINDTFK